MQSYIHNVVSPYMHEDVDEAMDSLQRKMRWTNLHRLVLRLDGHGPDVSLTGLLRETLALPGIAAQVNTVDSGGCPPLYYAVYSRQREAVDLLLRAGANPKLFDAIANAADAGAWESIGPLLRAGANFNQTKHYWRRTGLHLAAGFINVKKDHYRTAVELVRHGGHRIDWTKTDKFGDTPLAIAAWKQQRYPDNESCRLIHNLYSLPAGTQYLNFFNDPPENAPIPSLIQAGLAGDAQAIGEFILAGAMVNERDEDGCTLLHLFSIDDRIPNRWQVALELVRHGGYSVDWNSVTPDGKTALQLAQERLLAVDLNNVERKLSARIARLVRLHRLPADEAYIYPSMDPDYCRHCSSLRCCCVDDTNLSIPGGFPRGK